MTDTALIRNLSSLILHKSIMVALIYLILNNNWGMMYLGANGQLFSIGGRPTELADYYEIASKTGDQAEYHHPPTSNQDSLLFRNILLNNNNDLSLDSKPVNGPLEYQAVLGHLKNRQMLGNQDHISASDINELDPKLTGDLQVEQEDELAKLNLTSSQLGALYYQLTHERADNQQEVGSIDTNQDSTLRDKLNDELEHGWSILRAGQPIAPPPSRYGAAEFIDHPLALAGHQYVQGGAGEGRQLLGPEGSFENMQVVKSDRAVPAYCNPPNPCPIGYTSADGCLESFVNSASFSREYQAGQQCSCDNEHSLFNCDSPSSAPTSDGRDELSTSGPRVTENQLDSLARVIENRFGGLPTMRQLVAGE